ncbi:MAG: hypothetical protein P4L27_02185 [Ignavibacteriaceae bacterium]|nr:hypothetical protein [Ignavibacteriaceae bacterium]
MKNYRLLLIVLSFIFLAIGKTYAQQEEQINYFQLEPLDDSLFIHIQQEVFIDPPDPKAEIIADLRDQNNQTLSIKGVIYPFLAFKPDTRAKIQIYPFKLNLGESINYGSVFTRVFERIKIKKLVSPPTAFQISSTLQYINPFLQLFGGERFGFPIKNDIGLSAGLGTPYSGPLETNFIEANFHILGVKAGVFSSLDELTNMKIMSHNNNLYAVGGYQVGYVLPFGNFIEVSYTNVFNKATSSQIDKYKGILRGANGVAYDTLDPHVKIIDGSSMNWEFRYPISVLGSTRGKLYAGQYLNEWHIGYTGRELSLAGSTFDFRFDAMPHSDIREPEYVLDLLVQKIFDSWSFSAVAIGPTAIFGKDRYNKFTCTSLFLNIRLKVGTSL